MTRRMRLAPAPAPAPAHSRAGHSGLGVLRTATWNVVGKNALRRVAQCGAGERPWHRFSVRRMQLTHRRRAWRQVGYWQSHSGDIGGVNPI
jgi:hypothetical protein